MKIKKKIKNEIIAEGTDAKTIAFNDIVNEALSHWDKAEYDRLFNEWHFSHYYEDDLTVILLDNIFCLEYHGKEGYYTTHDTSEGWLFACHLFYD